ncbi:MAG TPA: hypothetical protein VE755_00415, partial [Myxococcales bacterium]|nr:hypothetical protein [Myxococcales bacterium]
MRHLVDDADTIAASLHFEALGRWGRTCGWLVREIRPRSASLDAHLRARHSGVRRARILGAALAGWLPGTGQSDRGSQDPARHLVSPEGGGNVALA